ncbi:dTDP-4-dehydrorhamnose reductase [Alteromonas ponticola]|uniref:dTDP-4-dehydrorhamnose reductase n=1 Tax=Alteromonas aquimaris TaxID=2998417 RepID=A0ABT3P5M8_9ALTE|nr:dTDP-4-dehydrorhamnose reductase [Alteromonas aquimaris]MCW8108074.1 dTDP-4-dehydrorhamnose reductase [Alteromonas aquimaris]
MSIVVIGKSGQLSFELQKILGTNATYLGRDDIDISDLDNLTNTLDTVQPTAIINASAYTAVDKAETDRDAAHTVNSEGVSNLASYCKSNDSFLVHVSTDYVFNGEKGSPYTIDDSIEPQGVYGETKAEGEKAVLSILPNASCLIRTAWVYSSHGNNFVKTMLRLMREKPQLTVIDDQVGTPTWGKGLAEVCVLSAQQKIAGTYHWTDEGVCSWYDFALAIQELAISKGILSSAIPILPIPSSQYPTPAKRPHYSVLDKTLSREAFKPLHLQHWRIQLSNMLDELYDNKEL